MKRIVRTNDGRALAVEEYGNPDGPVVLIHAGTPGSRFLYEPNVADATARGLRLIGYDRPGYGESDPRPGRDVADCAADVRAICEQLGIDRLATWGISGGGPHVLACAALLPDLVVAAASLASLAPFDAEGLDWFDGMGEANVEDFKLLSDEAATRAKVAADREIALTQSAGEISDELSTLLCPRDRDLLSGGPLVEHMVWSTKQGLAPGSEGWYEDGVALGTPWGFDLAAIKVPVMVMHGREDKFCPFGHGQWLAAHIPAAEARLTDDDGHLTLAEYRVPEVHAWLAEHF
jgi:pimeloyl-ACP methyl ester carboxylesterase